MTSFLLNYICKNPVSKKGIFYLYSISVLFHPVQGPRSEKGIPSKQLGPGSGYRTCDEDGGDDDKLRSQRRGEEWKHTPSYDGVGRVEHSLRPSCMAAALDCLPPVHLSGSLCSGFGCFDTPVNAAYF